MGEKSIFLVKENHVNKKINELLEKANQQRYLDGFDFSILMHNLLISDGGYVIDTGNYENVNAAVAKLLVEKIKSHPWIWKCFFMVA